MKEKRRSFWHALTWAALLMMQAAGCGTFSGEDEGEGDGDGAQNNAPAGGAPNTGGDLGAGNASSGGNTGSGGATVVSAECTTENVAACGGDVTGTWNVASSCLELSGDMDVSITSLGCPTVPVTGALEVSGTFTANADGTYVDNTVTTGSMEFPLDPSCLTVSSVDVECGNLGSVFEALGWTEVTCTETAGMCGCTLSVQQQGGLGAVVPYTEPEGFLQPEGSQFTMGAGTYSYCAEPDTLTVTPQMSGLTGQIVMVREGVMVGTGGGSGTGGTMGTGGESAAGGSPMTGGATSTGGDSATGGDTGTGGMDGTGGGSTVVSDKPCDIYGAAGNTCVAAHSTVRALFADYDGPLYQVKRADGQYQDIPVLSPGGYADSSVQDSFCAGSSCVMWRLYDQSGHGNFVEAQTPDSTVGGNTGMTAADADNEQIIVAGHPVYSLFTRPNQAYWNDGSQNGMPTGAEPQGIYMVTSGTHYNGACCYNYGNGQLDRLYSGGPMMDAVYFGDSTQWGHGSGDGPWVMADMEDGMLAGGNGDNDANISLPFTFVTAMEKNDGTTTFALKGGDATQPTLTTMWDGPLPSWKSPMEKQGAVILGAGGDCCLHNNNLSEGTFYEGAIVAGYPSDETDQAIHANIVEAGYGE